MLNKIQHLLRERPKQTARVIAAKLGLNKQVVNRLLYQHTDLFISDSTYQWSVLDESALIIDLGDQRWLTADDFENALGSSATPWGAKIKTVIFVVQEDCKIMLEALSLLLALCNQLADHGKSVTLDISSCKQTVSYLSRIGFFEHLRSAVTVLPRRPKVSAAVTFEGNNDGVVELRSILPDVSVKNTLDLLVNRFVSCAGQQYFHAAFTPLSELLNNVQEHSGVTKASFAGLQFYKRSKRIQTVISDNGLGIVGTLAPILPKRYPAIFQKVSKSPYPPEIALLQEVFLQGGISRDEGEGRGTGLFTSKMQAAKFNATISVRQESFLFKIHHDLNGVHFSHNMNLMKLCGSHICFDFSLD